MSTCGGVSGRLSEPSQSPWPLYWSSASSPVPDRCSPTASCDAIRVIRPTPRDSVVGCISAKHGYLTQRRFSGPKSSLLRMRSGSTSQICTSECSISTSSRAPITGSLLACCTAELIRVRLQAPIASRNGERRLRDNWGRVDADTRTTQPRSDIRVRVPPGGSKAWVIVDPATRRGRHPLTGQMRRFSAAPALFIDLSYEPATIRRNNGRGRSTTARRRERRGTSEERNPDQSCEGQGGKAQGEHCVLAGAHDQVRPVPGVDRGPDKAHGEAAPGKEEGQVVTARRPSESVGGSTPGAFDFSEKRGDR